MNSLLLPKYINAPKAFFRGKSLRLFLFTVALFCAGLCHSAVAESTAYDFVGTYEGVYTASQGLTRGVVVLQAINAKKMKCDLIFYADNSNPNVPTGHALLKGKVTGGELTLVGTGWIIRPPGYFIPDYVGILTSDLLDFTGDLFLPGTTVQLGTFEFKRLTKIP